MLTREMEGFPARHERRETWARLEQLADRGGGRKEMFEIVEQQEQLTVPQE